MRKSIYMICAAALLALSCENTIETVWSDQNKPMLVMNAQLIQDSQSHVIYVHCSEGSQCVDVPDAEVTCRINGGTQIKAEPSFWTVDWSTEARFGGYRLPASLAAGDEIALQATWKDKKATATITVPRSAATITAVDTARLVLSNEDGYYSTHITRQYRITVKDAPGESNFYMLRFEDVFYRIDAEGKKVASFVSRGSFDATDDHVLHPVENSMMEDLIGRDNSYETFTDEMFADASYTIKVTDSSWASYDSGWSEFWEQFEEGDYYSLDRRIKVYTLPFDEYIFLRAIDAADSDIGFMTEPVIYPSNVTGGLGFVAAATPTVWTLSFPAEPYNGYPPYDAYRYTDPVPDAPVY